MPQPRAYPAGRIAALTQLVLFVSACMTWRPEPVSPADLMADRKPDVVRITRPDSTRLIIRDPAIEGDTLYGRPQSALGENLEPRIAIPLADVSSIATLRSDPTRSTLLGVGIAVGTFSLLCFAADAFGCGSDEVFAVQVDLGR
jgi:hypothetical protein